MLKAANFTALNATHQSLDVNDPSSVSCTQDFESVKRLLLLLIEEGDDVVLIAHSYGEISASETAYGLRKVSQAIAGTEEGVVGIVHIAGF